MALGVVNLASAAQQLLHEEVASVGPLHNKQGGETEGGDWKIGGGVGVAVMGENEEKN